MAEKKSTVKSSISKEVAKTKRIKSSAQYIGANVRDEKGNIIDFIKNGTEVEIMEDISKSGDRVKIKGTSSSGNIVTGTVLKSCLK